MSNTVVAEYSFDSWGRRRDKDDWTYNLVGEPELFAGRGFTGHEWLPWFNLYNMNGRLYDPVVGRFLSPDNYVQMPDNTQNFNRYSYCINNPLKYTDPSGEIIFTILAAIFAPPLLPVAIAADIGGIINTVNHWDAIKNSDNLWQGFKKGTGLYVLGGTNGVLTYTSPGYSWSYLIWYWLWYNKNFCYNPESCSD
jgi:RHS repeat-associated protein